MSKEPLYPNRCGTCGDPIITDGTLHTWPGRMGLPERPYDHPSVDRRHAGLGLPCEICPGPCQIDDPVDGGAR